VLQRIPAFMNRNINYPHNGWISTRDLARKLDQVEQYTHHHSLEESVSERQFLLLDARGKKEYRVSHIQGAIHLPISAHLCMFVRPGFNKIQSHMFDPSAHSPLRKAKGKPIFDLLKNLNKDTEIVVYCAVGYRSGWITSALTKQGYNAICLYGGLYKWANEGRDIYQFKTDKKKPQYSGTKDHFLTKFSKFKQPKPANRDSPKAKESHHVPEKENSPRHHHLHEVVDQHVHVNLHVHKKKRDLSRKKRKKALNAKKGK